MGPGASKSQEPAKASTEGIGSQVGSSESNRFTKGSKYPKINSKCCQAPKQDIKNLHAYVCMHACMHVYTHICVCMYVCKHTSM